MKTTLITSALFLFLFALPTSAQDRTTVNATSSEISDNLDLRAIASLFGDAKNLEDFERQLNDPKIQISNLDLNDDNQVDYLRVIETVEGNTHLIIVQSVLGRDSYQDVATIEVEKDSNNQVQVQVVGDVYMYGQNYIYEPVYVTTPIIYSSFWVPTYRTYCSVWFWDYYPTFYYAWNPCPVFRYRNNVSLYINLNHHYNYVNVRHCHRAYALYEGRRSNYCERNAPNRGFAYRNNSIKNRHELDQTRTIKNVAIRNEVAYASTRNNYRKNETIGREIKTTRNTVSTTNAEPIKNSSTTRKNNIERNNTKLESSNPIRNSAPTRYSENTSNNTTREPKNTRSNTSNSTERQSDSKRESSNRFTQSRVNSSRENNRSESSQSRNESNARNGNTARQNNANTSRRG
jgi:hypothetical protein